MGENTKIEWADHSWSPWRGCTKVSPGCANCYAETLSKRNPKVLGEWGIGKPRVLSKSWNDPIRWDKEAGRVGARLGVFPSLCDWLDKEVPYEWLADFLCLIHDTPNIDWLLLTKRPENWDRMSFGAAQVLEPKSPAVSHWIALWRRGQAPDNVWFGVSVEDQKRAGERIPLLLSIPARIRWLSVEPLLGPVNVGRWCRPRWSGKLSERGTRPLESECLDWVVVGGESGPKARPCNVEWIRDIVGQCKLADVPVFVKQVGSKPTVTKMFPGQPVPNDFLAFSHPKGGDPSEWPEDIRVREFPV